MRTKDEILKDIDKLNQELKQLENFEKTEAHLYPFYDQSLHKKVSKLKEKIEEYNIPLRVTVNEKTGRLLLILKMILIKVI